MTDTATGALLVLGGVVAWFWWVIAKAPDDETPATDAEFDFDPAVTAWAEIVQIRRNMRRTLIEEIAADQASRLDTEWRQLAELLARYWPTGDNAA